VIEHPVATVKFITDRGVTHELVRHRLASYSQESTRYCNYGGDHIQFIRPIWSDIKLGIYTAPERVFYDIRLDTSINTAEKIWVRGMLWAEAEYKVLLEEGWRPEQARSVLPNSLKTEIVMTANLREWRHVFKLRCSKAAHPQIRELTLSCLDGFKQEIPILFDDLP
jgi:thymidylate synthase (FAD)